LFTPPSLCYLLFSFTAPPPTAIYTLSLHDALPICRAGRAAHARPVAGGRRPPGRPGAAPVAARGLALPLPGRGAVLPPAAGPLRSEEHTSELQSQSNLVCRLLLEKKKYNRHDRQTV